MKTNYGLTQGYANFIAFGYREQFETPQSGDDMLTEQYSVSKSSLKLLYDDLCKILQSFGNNVEISPRKTYVTIRRSKQFAIFKVSTKDRLDVGLILKGEPETLRLKSGKQFSGMMTHCVAVHSKKDIDSELIGWLKLAYKKD